MRDVSINELMVAASESARGAGAVAREFFGRATAYDIKSRDIDIVTEADKASERWLDAFFSRQYPDHGFVGEEGSHRETRCGITWVVDPLDGTTNFAHGIPTFGVSVAAFRDGEVVAGAVFDPMRDELFVAGLGHGARLNGKSIRVSETPTLSHALLASGFPYDRAERADFYLAYWKEAFQHVHGVLRMGAACLDLCWVAAGRFDGFWEYSLKVWDVAAASLVVREAGGEVSGMDGEAVDLSSGRIVASNPAIFPEFISMLKRVPRPAGVTPPAAPPRVHGL